MASLPAAVGYIAKDAMLAVSDGSTPGVAELKERRRTNSLDNLDATVLEQYLDDADFASTFGMSRMEFYALPKWKRRPLEPIL